MANPANWPSQPNGESDQAVNESNQMANPAELPSLVFPLSLFFQLSVCFAAFAVCLTFHLLRCFPCFRCFRSARGQGFGKFQNHCLLVCRQLFSRAIARQRAHFRSISRERSSLRRRRPGDAPPVLPQASSWGRPQLCQIRLRSHWAEIFGKTRALEFLS